VGADNCVSAVDLVSSSGGLVMVKFGVWLREARPVIAEMSFWLVKRRAGIRG